MKSRHLFSFTQGLALALLMLFMVPAMADQTVPTAETILYNVDISHVGLDGLVVSKRNQVATVADVTQNFEFSIFTSGDDYLSQAVVALVQGGSSQEHGRPASYNPAASQSLTNHRTNGPRGDPDRLWSLLPGKV